eukprot:CAMPEP_0198290182 /NCGR_PEP_ID=MMETSP1449-20131203/8138_1 /TAXON_ID=420275 /ORGANISM="Attheya septentrionalis, Strain CCMP2084" /LENGTH=327 /DNA_ID=CAMNT_0043988647 /DNA_START=721 /DNA_END=1704 /DNA_ORIENTATION=-
MIQPPNAILTNITNITQDGTEISTSTQMMKMTNHQFTGVFPEETIHAPLEPSRGISNTCHVGRISSEDAAGLIQTAYNHNSLLQPISNAKAKLIITPGLLVISSDASRGASRKTGLASILRWIEPNQEDDDDGGCDDTIQVVCRRTLAQRDVTYCEIAAIALGLKTALAYIQEQPESPSSPLWRVLIVSDCMAALDFYETKPVGMMSTVCDNSRAYRRALTRLSSKVVDISLTKVRSTHGADDGFLDHAAADFISRTTRSVANSQNREETHGKVPQLTHADLSWLAQSESPRKKETSTTKQQALQKSAQRATRCKQRIHEEFDILIP